MTDAQEIGRLLGKSMLLLSGVLAVKGLIVLAAVVAFVALFAIIFPDRFAALVGELQRRLTEA